MTDTSETNVKMCEKAEEIQELRREEKHQDTGKWKDGDFWTTVFGAIDSVFVVCRGNDAWADEPHYLHHPIEAIWLPRQDQLQEMCKHKDDIYTLLKAFALKVNSGRVFLIGNKGDCFTSMEQLWLAFVMKEKYNKVWDGKDWVRQS